MVDSAILYSAIRNSIRDLSQLSWQKNMAQAQLKINTILDGKQGSYRIIQLVGGGGMALVYRVEALQTLEQWALKVLHPFSSDPDDLIEAKRLFDQEASLLSALNHPNLPKVVDHFEESNRAFLVMEFIEGQSLQQLLEEATYGLLETEVLGWMIQVCYVLDYLHNQQPPIIFRDLKPGNVMLSNNGMIKLIDFGIARTYKVNKKKDTITMGSANYAPLEQWGKGQTDARSDVYGLGATIYHLLTKRLPPLASEPKLTSPTHHEPGISRETEEIVLKAMAKEPEDRYQSAQEMQLALQRALISLGGSPVVLPSYPVAVEPYPEPTSIQPPAPPEPEPVPPPVPQQAATPDPDPTVFPIPAAKPANICHYCGNSNRSHARFCGQCGKHLKGELQGALDLTTSDGRTHSLLLSQLPYLIGRGRSRDGSVPDLDLSLYDSKYVSRRHAKIARPHGEFTLTDLDSANGTLLNGLPLIPNTAKVLRSGDLISIGKARLTFRVIR